MAKKKSFKEKFFATVVPKVIGIGAAVVILGALFKIMHYPGAEVMLIAGMGTESLIFLITSFAPIPKDYHWEKVYPELEEDELEDLEEDLEEGEELPLQKKGSVVEQMDTMLADANIDQALVDRLGKSFGALSDHVAKIGDLEKATVASNKFAKTTEDYAKSVDNHKASVDVHAKSITASNDSLTQLNKSYATVVNSMSAMSNTADDSKKYSEQVKNVTKKMEALNAVYEMELGDANNHLKSMNKFYGSLAGAMENMTAANKESEAFKSEIGKLNSQLGSLNKVYGAMLTAMKG